MKVTTVNILMKQIIFLKFPWMGEEKSDAGLKQGWVQFWNKVVSDLTVI